MEPQIYQGASEYACRIPVDESLSYVVSIRGQKEPGVLIRSFFPDGEPHHYVKIDRLELTEAMSLFNAAALIVYGRLIPLCDGKQRPQTPLRSSAPLF
ncbi:MAG: hypothetical protein HY912_09950 [Desulfomonile tiedjei]|uniref:Uncharacterized protein n=1 Tax=Desulfomonile tiedjei TaxID=2358 RepID=A0A9D6Z0C7_9BACT|nr:hypothetical protein [Desulfomonile tiedjei]